MPRCMIWFLVPGMPGGELAGDWLSRFTGGVLMRDVMQEGLAAGGSTSTYHN